MKIKKDVYQCDNKQCAIVGTKSVSFDCDEGEWFCTACGEPLDLSIKDKPDVFSIMKEAMDGLYIGLQLEEAETHVDGNNGTMVISWYKQE